MLQLHSASGPKRKSPSPRLGERDRAVFEWFRDIRYAETGHFAAVLTPSVFPTEWVLRRRLRKLAQMGYIDRPARRITPEREQEFVLADETRERGRPQDVWALAQRGAEALELADATDWNRNNGRLRHSSFAHPLMISQVYTTVRILAAKEVIGLESWSGENTWRGRITVDGQLLPIVPDAVMVISVPRTGRQIPIFLETDNATEPLRRSAFEQSSFYKKVIAYREYWLKHFRPENDPMLVWTVAKTPTRAASLRDLTESIDAEQHGMNLFWFSDLTQWNLSAPERLVSAPIWKTATGTQVSFL